MSLSSRWLRATACAAIALSLAAATAAQERDRARIADKYKWDLSQIYKTDAEWRTAKDAIAAELPKIPAFKGTLGTSASRLADALELGTKLTQQLVRAYVYASMTADQDTRASQYQGMQQEMQQAQQEWEQENAKFDEAFALLKDERLRGFRARFDLGQDFIYGVFNAEENRLLGGTGLHTRAGQGAREIGQGQPEDPLRGGRVEGLARREHPGDLAQHAQADGEEEGGVGERRRR